MKIFVLNTVLILFPLLGRSQTIIWTEDFEAGGANWTMNTTDLSSTSTGYNKWVQNNSFASGTANVAFSFVTCADLGCLAVAIAATPNQPAGITGFPQSQYMHILYDPIVMGCTPGTTQNAHYLISDPNLTVCLTPPQNYFTKMNTGMSTAGQTNVSVSFWWTGKTATVAYGEFYYSIDGGISWTLGLGNLFNQLVWIKETLTLPVFDNQPDLRFAFRFVNGADAAAAGQEPAFSIDQIEVFIPSVVAPPVANFAASDTVICQGTCISFTDSSTNTPTSWNWSFPGAVPSSDTIKNPVNICYSAPGTYNVTLIATNGAGSDTLTKTGYITVDLAATASAGPDTNICDTASYTITGAAIGGSATTLTWTSSGSGTFNDSSLINATYTPSTADTAAGCVTLTITTNNPAGPCTAASDNMALCFYSCAAPVANFTASDTTICDSACINFTDLSINATGWSWYFPGGTPSTSTAQNPTGICFNSTGTYTISLVVTDTAGAQDSIAKINFIIVNSCLPPVADFTASSTTICKNTCTNFTDLSANTPTGWSWSFQGGSPPTSPSQNPTNICFGTAGTFTISLKVTNAYGQDSIAKINYIVVDSCTAPVADFTANDTVICTEDTVDFTPLSPGATSWSWQFSGGDPSISLDSTPSVVYDAEGTYDVTLTVSNINGTDDTTFTGYITVTICTPPVAGFAADTTTICEGACINFTDLSTNSPTSWRWSFPGGSPSSDTVPNPAGICYTAPGTYEVSLIAANAFGPDTLIQASYIIVKPLPAVNASDDITIAPGGSASLTAGGAGSYSWSPDAGLSSDTGAAVTASPASTTTYIVTGTTNDCPAKDSVTVYVEAVFVPNVFSPGGTGGSLDNKVLKVYGSGIRSIEFRIFDRWGELVYETNSVNQAMNVGWNGRFNDEPLNPATFVYTLKVIFNNGNEFLENGNIALIR